MASLTFSQRLLGALIVLLLINFLTTPFITWWWIGTVLALTIRVASLVVVWKYLKSFVDHQHESFRAAIQQTVGNLTTGKRGPRLFELNSRDSFGMVGQDIDRLADGISEHISYQLSTNHQLESNKQLFQSILGTMVEGVLVLDAQRNVLYFNSAAKKMLDCESRQIEGRPLWEVVRQQELHQVMDSSFSTDGAFRHEVEFQRNRRRVEISAAPLELQRERADETSGSSPEAKGIVLVLHDVTEVRKLEQMRREFVSNVSHELKTPLTSIQLSADTLLDGEMDDPERKTQYLNRILDQTHRLQVLIDDMLKLAKIESLADAYSFEPVSLKSVIQKSIERHEPVAASNQIAISFDEQHLDVQIEADSSGLQTIVDNLLTNAITYNRLGGQVSISGQLKDGTVFLEVQDNGIGIPKEHLDRVFERFYRVDKARTQGQGGTGLGLAIVKHLAVIFKGDIRVESENGRGTKFILRLPVFNENLSV